MPSENEENKFIGMFVKALPAIVTVVGVIVGVYIWVAEPINQLKLQNALLQQEVSTIKNNDLKHIEQSLTDLKVLLQSHEADQIEVEKNIARILTILERE